MQRCDQMNKTEFVVESSSSTKEYRVRAFLPDDEPPTCDCVAFAISRNRDGGKNHGGKGWCKHLEQIMDETCTWQDGIEPEPQTIPGVCPRCGGSASEADATVLPESPVKAAEVVTQSLQNLMADLEKKVGT